MASELAGAIPVDFPLRGEWHAYHTPATRIPSHGTDMLGQRFAFDFIRIDDRRGWNFHPAAGTWRGNLLGGRTAESYGWGAPIHAPLDGEVVQAVDGVRERAWIHPLRELAIVLKNAVTFDPRRLERVLGNHVILRVGEPYALFAHMTTGSVAVARGQHVRMGDLLGRVGHTGNSTAPHLHFQLMDSADPMTANGVPSAFRAYDVRREGGWELVHNAIPLRTDRIRSV